MIVKNFMDIFISNLAVYLNAYYGMWYFMSASNLNAIILC